MKKAIRKKQEKAARPQAAGISKQAKERNTLIIAGIVLCTMLLFFKVCHYKFLYWDDDFYVTENVLIKDLSFAGLKRIFTTPVSGMYNPLLFLLYAIEYKFWGLNPMPFHFWCLVAHVVAILFTYKFIYKLTLRYETATIVTILFAIHPMHVAVIAWVAEMKTSLFFIFYLAALIQYLKYLETGYRLKYLIYIALLFIVSVLFKPEAITLAPVLFLLDYYKGRKLDWRLFLEKIPFFAISLVFGVITIFTHLQSGDTIFSTVNNYSPINFLLVANYGVTFYFEKLFLPFNLSPLYSYPKNAVLLPAKYYLSIPVLPLIIWLVYSWKSFRRELIFGLLFFAITISILLRLYPTGFFQTADRYSYLSYIGLFFIFGNFYVYVVDAKLPLKWIKKEYLTTAFVACVVIFGYLAANSIGVWADSSALFEDMVQKEPASAVAYNSRAWTRFTDNGDYNGALADLSKAIELDSTYSLAYLNEIGFKMKANDFNGALNACNRFLSIHPESFDGHLNLSAIYLSTGNYFPASSQAQIAIRLSPNDGRPYYNMGLAKLKLHDTIGCINSMKKSYALGYNDARQYILNY